MIPEKLINSAGAVAIKIDSNLDPVVGNAKEQNFSVSSSNPNVATAHVDYSLLKYKENKNDTKATIPDDGYKNFLMVYPHGKGTTKITITALDGTNKKVTITVKVQ